jgi:hypothetical protein
MQIYDETINLASPKLLPDSPRIQLPGTELLDTLGRGDTKVSEKQANFQSRARKKAISNPLNMKLLEVKDSPLRPRYLAAMSCSNYLFQDGLKITSRYCRQRSCLICNSILTMKLIKGYKASIDAMAEPVFLTLTFGRIQAVELKYTINGMKKQLSDIFRRLRVRKRRNGEAAVLINAICKFECVYDHFKKNQFHPHFHLIVDGLKNAKDIKREWLKDLRNCSPRGQHVKLISNRGDAAQELFKYVSKLITDKPFNAFGFDAILQATMNKPIYICYGNIKRVDENISDIESRFIDFKESQTQVWKIAKHAFDWICPEGELFSGYKPTDEDLYVIKNSRYSKNKFKL